MSFTYFVCLLFLFLQFIVDLLVSSAGTDVFLRLSVFFTSFVESLLFLLFFFRLLYLFCSVPSSSFYFFISASLFMVTHCHFHFIYFTLSVFFSLSLLFMHFFSLSMFCICALQLLLFIFHFSAVWSFLGLAWVRMSLLFGLASLLIVIYFFFLASFTLF